jgi:hypothetical protein
MEASLCRGFAVVPQAEAHLGKPDTLETQASESAQPSPIVEPPGSDRPAPESRPTPPPVQDPYEEEQPFSD